MKLEGVARYESKEYWKQIRNFKSGLLTDIVSYSEQDSFGNEVEFDKKGKMVVMVNEDSGTIKIVTRPPLTKHESIVHDRHPIFLSELKETKELCTLVSTS
jgi:hypothetical protein